MAVDVPVLVFALADHPVHHGALGIIRSAGRLGVPVYTANTTNRSPIARSRYWRGGLDLASAIGDEERLDALRSFSSEHGRSILIAVDDASAMFVEQYASSLAEDFLFPHQPPGLVRALASKREMHALCLEHGIPTPAIEIPASEADVLLHTDRSSFPIVLKRIDASLPCAPNAPSVVIAATREELLDAYRLMQSPAGSNVLLQQYIPGNSETVWMFNGYFDSGSDCLIAVTGQKIRQSPPETGATTLGVCRANATVEDTTRRFMKALGYRGILDIGYRWDARDGQYKLLDVNPRIGATFRLFAGDGDLDVFRTLYLDLTGQPVPSTAAREGRRWVVEPLDVRWSLSYLRATDMRVRDWLASYRGVEEAAWWASDDPQPFVAVTTSLLGNRLRNQLARR